MDPSAAPWRVLESGAAAPPGGGPPGEPENPPARAFLVSPITAAAVVGAIALAVAAFLLASTSTGAGVVDVRGGSGLAPIAGIGGSGAPDDAAGVGGAGTEVLVVEIAGAVLHPGVFRMPVGSRIGDLIDAAGGYGPRLDAGRANRELNLAAKLADGDRVTVPNRDEAASSTSGTTDSGSDPGGGGSASAVIDLNRATASELEALPGIGPVTAAKIIASREETAFTAIDDLRTRKLVGTKTFDKLKDLVAVR